IATLYQCEDDYGNRLDEFDYRVQARQITEGEAIHKLREAGFLRWDEDWPKELQGRIGTRSKAKPVAPTTPTRDTPRPTGAMTPNTLARYLHVSPDKVRSWIKRGKLEAINTASAKCRKPRWVITPEALASFESRQKPETPPKSAPRPKRQHGMVDYFP